jgi:2-phosphosulfolactate phosphatase
MPFYDQSEAECRVEWGVMATTFLAPADVVIVVDVLSFSTCVDVATERGATILPYAWKDSSAESYAARQSAALAGARGVAQYSLSATSFLSAGPDLRCVLPSPNGAAVSVCAAARTPIVFTACLRNADAVAAAASRAGTTFNVCPAGERWTDGSLRPALEDWLGAGAVLARLPGKKSPEATAAIAAFQHAKSMIEQVLVSSSSGRELVERGFASDVQLAGSYNVSRSAPRLHNGAYYNGLNASNLP